MPGLTDNELTIEALNQAIVALNEITGSLPGGVDTSTIEDNLALAAQKIDDVRVVLETQSVAEITAQNTNFNDLIGVLGALQLVCQSITKVSPQSYFDPIQQPADPGGEGIPAPEGFEEIEAPEQFIQDRRCFMANKIVDETANWLLQADALQLDEIGNVTFTSFMAIWIGGLVTLASESALLATITASVSGILSSIASYVYNNVGLVEFSDIHTAMVNRRDDLVCALFEAQSVQFARGDFVAVLEDEGLDVVNRGFVANILPDSYMNHLFYKGDDQAEAEYQLASGYDCDTCDDVCDLRANLIVSDDGTTLVLDAVQFPDAWYAGVFFSATEAYQPCPETFTITDVSITGGAMNPLVPAGFRFYSGGQTAVGDIYHGNTPPTSPLMGVRTALFKSSTYFRIQLDYVEE